LQTSPGKLRLLIVEDEPADVELVLHSLRQAGFAVRADVAQTAEEFTDHVRKNSYDLILADYKLPSWNGMESIEILRQEGLDVPVIVVSGSLGEHRAVECIKRGAADYVLKDHLARLPVSVRRAMSERRLREEHQQAQKELARSNQDLEQFAYVASHDLQEPLRMVATYTQLLAERYRGQLDDNADKYIHYAVDGALRMQALVEDLLIFSRIGRQGTDLQSTDCNAVLEMAVKNLHTAIHESSAQVTHDPLPTVMADGSQLLQVFQNLVGNALPCGTSVAFPNS
jgi:signal transduction histidine kinase